jgi:hypothetical protein
VTVTQSFDPKPAGGRCFVEGLAAIGPVGFVMILIDRDWSRHGASECSKYCGPQILEDCRTDLE